MASRDGIRITIDHTSFKQVHDAATRLVERAHRRAVNRTIGSVRTFVSKELVEKTGLRKKDILPRLWMHKADTKNQPAALTRVGKGMPLYLFKAKPKKVQTSRGQRIGVTAMVKGQRQFIQGGFLATMHSNGKIGVWERRADKRFPIKQLFSNEIQDIIRSDSGFLPKVKAYAEGVFKKNFEADYAYFLSKEGRPTK